MNRIISTLSTVITPVIKVAYDLQSTESDINIKKTSGSDVVICQSSLSVNAVTKEQHTEDNVTYTTISVPMQDTKSADRKYYFIFKLKNKYNVSVPLNEGTTILFSSKLLTHRQTCNGCEATDDELSFNFACYGNKKLYNHIRNSFIRNGID